MKILYDHQMFSIQKFGGVSRYFTELMKNVRLEHQVKLALLSSDNYHLQENYEIFRKRNILGDKNFRGRYFLQKIITAVNQFNSARCVAANNFDVFHPTYYNDYFLGSLRKPFVVTVHDLIVFKFEDTFYTPDAVRAQMENVIRRANRIIAVSENTKKDLTEVLNINPDKIDVVYHGYRESGSTEKSDRYGKYILFIGRRGRYKNFQTFARAISKLLNREKDIKLVCVGPPFNTEELELFAELGISTQAVATNVGDRSLNELYAGALAFVFPSLYEGFGMPILEAFANNCPVCLSDASCFPEVAGDAGAYFDPNSHESILNSVEKVIYDSGFAQQLVHEGQNRLKHFSWEKAATETISTYKKVM